jgi:predicted nucleotide-binding protein (sugar kinase/HSP70/actin superfamily)
MCAQKGGLVNQPTMDGATADVFRRKIWIPHMPKGSSKAFAAAFRSVGIESEVLPDSDALTRELGAKFTCGDECYPMKLTLGDFLKVLEQPGTDPARTTFMMPSGQGPCRFGQYAVHIKRVLAELGYPQVLVLSPQCEQGYSDIVDAAPSFVRTAWRALVAADMLQKRLLQTRPYEIEPGSADRLFENSIEDLCRTIEKTCRSAGEQLSAIQASLCRSRECFRLFPVRTEERRPLIGIVGEIFCRLNTFSNEDLVRRLELLGGEAWINDIAEWVAYVNNEEFRWLRLKGDLLSTTGLGAYVRTVFQRRDEHALVSLFSEDFQGYEEPHAIEEVLKLADPYLPRSGALGEMTVNIGKTIYYAGKGLDGVIDISPFTCMNGIVSESIYPLISRDLNGFPIRSFYFDGTQSDLDRDLGIFLELARNYRRHRLSRQRESSPPLTLKATA